MMADGTQDGPAFETRFGALVLAAARHRRYQALAVADLAPLLLAPLRAGCVAAGATRGEQGAAGTAIWCSVSAEVSARIGAEADRGAFPVRLARDEWRSGDEVWLLDILAPDQTVGTAVFAAFSQRIAGRFRMHPVVARALTPEIVAQITAAVADRDAPAAGTA